MPIISRFYGIVIRMYFQQAEHNPPHIHAIYGDDVAEIDIRTGDIIEGELPPRALSLIREWLAASNTRQALLDMWNTQQFRKLPPLK